MTKQKLVAAIKKLEQSAQKIVETRGYGEEPAKLKILSELIKEQLKNEDSRYSTRPIR